MSPSNLLETQVLIALVIQAVLLPLSLLLLLGATRRRRWLLLPWIVAWAPIVPAGLVASVISVLHIPGLYKQLLSLVPLMGTVLLLFPTWFTALHLFAALAPPSASALLQAYSSRSSLNQASKDQDLIFKYFYA